MTKKDECKVLIAGIGGASLGTEIFKCLRDAGNYAVYGCDVSEYAFGHFQDGFIDTFIVSKNDYVEQIYEYCQKLGIKAVIPGGEGPLSLLGPVVEEFQRNGIHIATNSSEVVNICSDKGRLFAALSDLNIPTPRTLIINDFADLEDKSGADFPCPSVIKPTTGSGGSRFVFLASKPEEIKIYTEFLLRQKQTPLIQEYVAVDEGEFTIGVLSLPDGSTAGAIAMQRMFNAKLSVLFETEAGLISSGYSQGLIDHFPEVCIQAEKIARTIGSVGPVNIQGRLRNGVLLPFEINPRFSASTYLRALAGFNEIDLYLKFVIDQITPPPMKIRPGYYLRSLCETFVPKEKIFNP